MQKRLFGLSMILVLAAVSPGCIGEDGPGTDEIGDPPARETTPEGPTSYAWGFSGCDIVVAIVPVDEAKLSEHLPDGFRPLSGPEAFGLPPDPRGDALIGLNAFACDRGNGLPGQTVEGLDYSIIFTPVDPPENVAFPEETDARLYVWRTLVPDQPRRDTLASHGLPVVDGDTDLSGMQVTPAGHTFEATTKLGEESYRFTGSTNAPAEDFRDGIPLVQFQLADGGFALWASLENAAPDATQGTGTVELHPEGWVAEVVGGTTTQAFMVAATGVHFEAATVTVP